MHFQSTKKGRAFQTLKSKLAFLERIYLEIKTPMIKLMFFLTFEMPKLLFLTCQLIVQKMKELSKKTPQSNPRGLCRWFSIKDLFNTEKKLALGYVARVFVSRSRSPTQLMVIQRFFRILSNTVCAPPYKRKAAHASTTLEPLHQSLGFGRT